MSLCVTLPHSRRYRKWREKQQDEIKARDEASKAKRQEIISKAERALEDFYEDYSRKKEKNIAENKCVTFSLYPLWADILYQGCRGRLRCVARSFSCWWFDVEPHL